MFVELLTKSNYSFLQGASFPEEMVKQAKALSCPAVGIADAYGVYGAPRAHVAAKSLNIPLIIGTELTLKGDFPVFLLAKNRKGYGDLCEILTQCHFNREDTQAPPPPLDWEALWHYSKDCFLLFPSLQTSAELLKEGIKKHSSLFLVVSRFLDGSSSDKKAVELGKALHLPCIASNQPLFQKKSLKPLQDILSCIKHGCTLEEGGFRLLPNSERYLKSPSQMWTLFQDHPQWLKNTLSIAEQCRFSLDEIRYRYPVEWIPEGLTADGYLKKLVQTQLPKRYTFATAQIHQQIAHELSLIEDMQYADYFLTIWDIVEFAKSQRILCQGRGSAANSIVCYILGITSIDPIRMELLFERFISRNRAEPPDIDIDFEHERREEVIQYIYRRYGRHRAAITAEVICYRRKSAIREIANVFGIPVSVVEAIQTTTHRRSLGEVPWEELRKVSLEIEEERFRMYWKAVNAFIGYPRHLGTHVGGFVLCQESLNRNVPIEKAAMKNRTIVQWDKNDLDALGYVRVDILGLGILTCIRKSFELLEKHYGISYTLATVPAEDPRVYDQLCQGDTIGVFQIESRAQMNMLPRLKPRNFFDLVVEISLVRPGPIQGDMVHPYLKRRAGKEAVHYPHPELKAILHKTYGVPVFQEQIMKIAMTVAGFTAGEADELRRAMGVWRRDGKDHLHRMGERFQKGLMAKGIDPVFAEKIFHQIEGFAEYGFPESHAASFSILAYVTSYLKLYHQDVFVIALLNSQPMGFYSAHSLIHDAKRHGVNFLQVDINRSEWDNTLEKPQNVRLGFRQVYGLKQKIGEAISKQRNTPFLSLKDFVQRMKGFSSLCRRDLFLLAGANAFESLNLSRREALWEIQGLELRENEAFSPDEGPTLLPREGSWERITLDYETHGVSLYSHPMAFLRPEMISHHILSSDQLKKTPPRRLIKVAGMVICRQMPGTSKGVLFITLEDEFGFTNIVVWRKIYEKYRETILKHSFLACEGRIEIPDDAKVIHVIAEKIQPLLTRSPKTLSHDWH